MISVTNTVNNTTVERGLRCRGWCFTINNPTPIDQDMIEKLGLADKTVWLIYGVEKGASGTLHMQGYVYRKNAVTLGSLKSVHSGAHWEPAKGNFKQQRAYCSKGNQSKEEWDMLGVGGPNYGVDADVHEWGCQPRDPHEQRIEASAKGGEANKRKYEDTFSKAKEGKFEDISKDHLIKHYNTIKSISKDFGPRKSNIADVCGILLYGRPGTGKSRFARQKFGEEKDLLFIKEANKWWDGYNGQPYVLIEDPSPFVPNIASFAHFLKIWTDMYAFPAQFKGGYINARPKVIIVSSNYTIDELFASIKDSVLRWALSRRFKVINFDILFNVADYPPFFPIPPESKLPYHVDQYCFQTINDCLNMELDHEREEVGQEDINLDDEYFNIDSASDSVVETQSQLSSPSVAISGSPSQTPLASQHYTVPHVMSSLTIGNSSLHRSTAINPLTPGSACTRPTQLSMGIESNAGARTSSKEWLKTSERKRKPQGGVMSTLSRWNGLMAAAGLSQESIVTVGSASNSSARPFKSTSTKASGVCSNLLDSDTDGDVCEDMDLNHSAGDYDLEDNFIASDDDFYNVKVKCRKTSSFLDSSSESSDSECDN